MNLDNNHDRVHRVPTVSGTVVGVPCPVPVGDTVHRSPDTAENGTVSGHGPTIRAAA